MPVAWRIVKKKHQKDALTGEGARRYGGRWNSPGQPLIYSAETLSGALLEILAHSDRRLLPYYSIYRLEIPKRIVSDVLTSELPDNWRSSPAPPELAQIGDQWIADQRSAVLRVPNSIVSLEMNYLINPVHKEFPLIQIEGPLDYIIDDRFV